MDHKPLDLEEHKGESRAQVWTRRIMFVLLIVLCISFAAPTFGSCSGAFGTGGGPVVASFEIGPEKIDVAAAQFERYDLRLRSVYQLFRPGGDIDEAEVWSALILDEVAKREGIHVSDEQVSRFLERMPEFQTNGAFDPKKYAARIREFQRHTGLDHEGLTAGLRSILRGSVYQSAWLAAYDVPDSRKAYDEWKKRNLKITADYVVQEYAPLRDEALRMPVTEDDLRAARPLPEVTKILAIPARRGIEAAYMRVREITDEHRTKMEEFAASAGVLAADESVAQRAWMQFWDHCKAGGIYSQESWRAWQGRVHDEAVRAWEAAPEASRGEKPKDPRDEAYPAEPKDQFEKIWAPHVVKEVLAREVLRHMVLRAERESKGLADLLPAYEAMGVRVVATAEPISDADFNEKFPERLGKDSEFGQSILRVRMPDDPATFTPKYMVEPAPTTILNYFPEDRGYVVARITSYEKASSKDVLDPEVRPRVEAYVREHRAADLASGRLKEMRTAVDAAGEGVEARRAAFRDRAAAAGLEVRTLRRFNQRTAKPTPAADPSGEAAIAAAARTRHRNRMVDDYPVLSRLDLGRMRDPVLADDATGAAYLALVVEKYEPPPIEMDEATLRIQNMILARQSQQAAMEALSAKEVTKRFHLTYAKKEAPRTE